MNYRMPEVALFVFLVLLFVPLSCNGAVTTRPYLQVTAVFWGSSQAPIIVQPGDQDQPLIITVSSLGDNVAYHAEASLTLDYPFSYILAQPWQNNTIQVELGVMQILSSLPVRFVLDIDPLAKNGVYSQEQRNAFAPAQILDETYRAHGAVEREVKQA